MQPSIINPDIKALLCTSPAGNTKLTAKSCILRPLAQLPMSKQMIYFTRCSNNNKYITLLNRTYNFVEMLKSLQYSSSVTIIYRSNIFIMLDVLMGEE